MKADREHDLYMEWSTIVEAPTYVGNRAQMLAHLGVLDDASRERMDRADTLGSSSLRDPMSSYTGPLDGAWDDSGFIVQQKGWLPRERLYDWLAAACPDSMLDPFEDEP